MKKIFNSQPKALFKVYPENFFRILKLTNLLLFVTILNVFGSKTYSEYAGFDLNMQQIRFTGTVTDEKGSPLPGVAVIVKGTTLGTLTDGSGKYTMPDAPQNSTLVFSFIGMAPQEIQAAGRTIIDVVLKEEAFGLDEVVVIGYGTAKKKDLTGSVASVKSEIVENEKPQAVQDMLRGTIAGLEVGFSTDAKGGGDLEIRGVNTLQTYDQNNQIQVGPLVVVDGVIYPGAMADINPNDIASIDVLKDASSSAVFGARAANGVILITTKKGKSGKAVINFNSSFGLATMAKVADVYGPNEFLAWRTDVMKSLNRYNPTMKDKLYVFDNPDKLPEGITTDIWKDGNASTDLTTIWLNRLAMYPAAIQRYKDGTSVNWGDLIFQNGVRQDHNLSLSGKKEDVTYYWSVGYQDNNGIIVGDRFKTIRTRVNLDGKVNKWLDVGMSTQYANRDESGLPATWSAIVLVDPWKTDKNPDGTLFIGDDLPVGVRHPLYDQSYTKLRQTYNTLISSFYATIKLPFGISYQATFSPRMEWYEYMRHQSALHAEWKVYGGSADRRQTETFSWQLDNMIKWNKTINQDHQIDVTLLANAEKYQSWSNRMSAQGFSPTDALGYHFMDAGLSSSYSIKSEDNYSTGDALMARLFYSFRSKYMATLSVRRDGYSAFGMGNPRGTFPAVALGWIFTDESFLKNDILTYGKLRFSWGENGNREVGRYAALSNMATGKYPYSSLTGNVFEINRLYVNRMANSSLRWERSRSVNIGVDFSIKNDLISGSIDYYKSRTLDLLINRNLPNVTGFKSVTSNMGEVDNNGIEITVNANPIVKENLKWLSTLTFYMNRNKIQHLYGNLVDVLDASGNVIGQKESDDITNNWFIGHAIDQIWDYKILGVWQQSEEAEAKSFGVFPGDFKIQDTNGDGKLSILDKVFQGYKEPRFRWNLRENFTIYKNFDLSFSMYSYWGNYDNFNEALNNGSSIGVSYYADRNSSFITPYWTPENPINDYARIFSNKSGLDYTVWREKSFIRLDNLSLTYSLPAPLLEKVKISNLKLTATIRNCAVWAPKWVFWDPEYSGPNPRFFTFGISLTL